MTRAWRISNYADLQGLGGERGTGRWHRYARIVYCAEHAANAMLETLVHLEIDSPEDLPVSYQLLEIEIPDEVAVAAVDSGELLEGWHTHEAITQQIGMGWLNARQHAVLRVPSVVMPHEFNVLINPDHADAARIRVVRAQRYPYDPRLVKTMGH